MIPKTCETCHPSNDSMTCGDCQKDPALPAWRPSRDALEAEVERLTKERDEERGHEKILSDAVTYWQGKTLMAADERAAEERSERAGLDGQLAEAERRRDELRAEVERLNGELRDLRTALDVEVAHAREEASASVARLESELGGLRHSLAEVEDERDEAVSAMAEWRARAEVAEPERDRLRDGLRWALEFIARCRWDEEGEISHRDLEMLERLRALLGEANEGDAS